MRPKKTVPSHLLQSLSRRRLEKSEKAWYDERTMKKPATPSLCMMMRSAEVMSLGYGALGRE
jgi:hypothetical protein